MQYKFLWRKMNSEKLKLPSSHSWMFRIFSDLFHSFCFVLTCNIFVYPSFSPLTSFFNCIKNKYYFQFLQLKRSRKQINMLLMSHSVSSVSLFCLFMRNSSKFPPKTVNYVQLSACSVTGSSSFYFISEDSFSIQH